MYFINISLSKNNFLTNNKANDGILIPDKARLYLVGVEDRNYKNDMIHCIYMYI